MNIAIIIINNLATAAEAVAVHFITGNIIAVISIIAHLRILVLQCRTQLAGRHEDFMGEQKVAHTGICRETSITTTQS